MLATVLILAAPLLSSAPSIAGVCPSGEEVPANLLRISLAFRSVQSVPVAPNLALMSADGRDLGRVFYPQDLWSSDGRIDSVLLNPGRVKSGLVARERLGPLLTAGDRVTLSFRGRPIKVWRVTEDLVATPDPSEWILNVPRPGTREPLRVDLRRPVDCVAVDLIAVADAHGDRLPGRAQLLRQEREWYFQPANPWLPGRYALRIHRELEDSAGNRIGQTFEMGSRSKLQDGGGQTQTSIDFSVSR